MYLLKVDEIAKVTQDVENEGINFSHLSTDLVDHICCEIESYMNHGISFTEAYNEVKKKFGIKGLRLIQQDTLMLIDKNYRIMKNSMKTIGAISLALMAFGALFKIMHWPFAGYLLFISYLSVALVFFPTLLYVMYRDTNQKKQAIIYIVAFISGLVFLAGVLFKVMHWPFAQLLFFPGMALITYLLLPLILITRINKLKTNKTVFALGLISLMIVLSGLLFKINHWPFAGILLDLGAIFMVLVFVPMFYFKEVQYSEKLRLDFLFGIIVITFFIAFTFLQSYPTSQNLLIDMNYQTKSYDVNASLLNEKNKEFIQEIHPDSIQFAKDADIICEEIGALENQIYEKSYSANKVKSSTPNEEITTKSDQESLVNYILPENNSESLLLKVKSHLENFNKQYSSILGNGSEKIYPENHILDTSNKIVGPDNVSLPWEMYYFGNISPEKALHTLSFLNYNIRLAENKALSMLVSNSKINSDEK